MSKLGIGKGVSIFLGKKKLEPTIPVLPEVTDQISSYFNHNNRFGVAADIFAGSATTVVTIEYGPTVSYGSSIACDNVSAGATVVRTGIMPQLTPGTYNFRFVATNSVGTVYGSNQTFTVKPGVGNLSPIYTLPTLVGTIYYIDPTAPTNGNGLSESTPFNNWSSVSSLTSSRTYLQKAGTTAEFSAGFRSIAGICKIGSYGTGTLPKIVSTGNTQYFMQSSFQIIIDGIEVEGTFKNASNMFVNTGIRLRNSPNSYIVNSKFHGFGQPIVLAPINGINGSSWSGCNIINCEIYDASLDGMYIDDVTDVTVSHCYIHDVNQLWYVDTNENVSAGDGIQAAFTDTGGDYLRLTFHSNTIDRRATGNKFCIIYGAGPNAMRATAVVTNNVFMMGDLGVGGVYLDNTVEPSTFYNNIFTGGTFGIHNRSSAGLTIHHNMFEDVGLAISNIINQGIGVIYHNVFKACDYCMSIYTGTIITVRNNYYLNTVNAVFFGNTYAVLTSNNNVYENSAPTASHATLAAFVTATGQDANSYTGSLETNDPANSDYRPKSASVLLSNGFYIAGIDEDFIGDIINSSDTTIGLLQNAVAGGGR